MSSGKLLLNTVLSGDRGARVTLLGLLSNVGLTAVKGGAGWCAHHYPTTKANRLRNYIRYLNSAVLIADAGHSLSGEDDALLVDSLPLMYFDGIDLMGDCVTLFFYTFSRRPPSKSYPYGYGKFESLGTVSGINK